MKLKKSQKDQFKGRCGSIARVVSCVSFLLLTIIGVSSLVHAMTLEAIANENGIPLSWNTSSTGKADAITVPITYWDQRQDSCNENLQFETGMCNISGPSGATQGIVRDALGADGLPVPKYETVASARAGGMHRTSQAVVGHNPVQPTDNFYRWFHEAYDSNGKQLSKQVDREATFKRVGEHTYSYGGTSIFPLDNVDFSKDDAYWRYGHNFSFTAHLRVPIKVSASGDELFNFSGDDDVWVFLNNQLVLDIGGLHSAISGWFKINADGTVTSYVNGIGYKTINVGLQEGDVVNLDFFYAERSTTGSNTEITISNMNWPIAADSNISNDIVGKVSNTESNLVQNISSITNRDSINPMMLEKIAAYVQETEIITDIYDRTTTNTHQGFLPLSAQTLSYTTTPDDEASWQPLDITPPADNDAGFKLTTPLRIAPSGQPGDTIYFRYYTETTDFSGNMTSQISYYTTLNGAPGLSYDYNKIEYTSDKRTEPVVSKIRARYAHLDTSEAAPSSLQIVDPGTAYEVISPEIDGFTPNVARTTGIASADDVDFAVIYAPNETTDEAPDDTEEKPEIPTEPTEKHTVSVKYLYENGDYIATSTTPEIAKGDSHNIISPTIEGYVPSQGAVEGVVDGQNIEFTVTYTKKPTSIPAIPLIPATQTRPTPPSIDENAKNEPTAETVTNVSDDLSLAYLAPLGEVAFVPNTGIVSDTVSAIRGTFADIILSQWFVMGTLLVFAGSFAIYFSCRRYIAVAHVEKSDTKGKKTTAKKSPAKKATKATKNTKTTKSTTKKSSTKK